jgi:acyl carrier protein
VTTTPTVDPELRSLLAELCDLDAVQVSPDVKLVALGLDSVLMVELGVAIEDIFGVHLGEEDVVGLVTVGDLDACVRRLRASAAS